MNEWRKTPFAEILADSKDGEWGESEEGAGLRETIVIRGTDFSNINDSSAIFPRRWIKGRVIERKALRAGDIILETAGGTSHQSTGRSALLKESFYQNHAGFPVLCASFCRHLKIRTENYSPRFIYYLLQTLYRNGYMAVFNIQHTGVSRFQYTSFKRHTELPIARLCIQRSIAAVLSAYDDLIENNTRKIALLSKLAEEIYREWFVRLRFPGSKKTKFIKGIPFDWELKRLKCVAEFHYGKALKETDRTPGEFNVYGSSGVVGTHNEALVKAAGLIVGRKGNVGSVYFSSKGFFPIDTVYFVKSNLPNSFLYFLLRSMNFINNDSAVPGLNRNQALSNEFFLPPDHLIKSYAKMIDPVFEAIREFTALNRQLGRGRDILMPRLISGGLSVEDLNIQFPLGMAEELNGEASATANA
jgi:restriction endonuclease S subunit